MLKRTLRKASQSAYSARDRAMILLSVKAGLRACEIAGLDPSMALDPSGKVAEFLAVSDAIARKRSGRRIPMHSDLRRPPKIVERERDRRSDEGVPLRNAR